MRKLIRCTAALLLSAGGLLALGPASTAAVSAPPFRANASATGLEVATVAPGGVATDEPVDSGGPTGQASLDSVGDTDGYAAFPDPGAFIGSAPGLGAGALAGTPASALPTPSYPLSVNASSTSPSASAGTGPQMLRATASPTAATGSAEDVVSVPGVGSVTTTDRASVTVGSDGTVTATATTSVQGLTIGPLKLGEITATATERLSPDGRVTPSTSISVVGARIGTVPVTISPSAPNNATVNSILAAAGYKLSYASATELPGEIEAPALELTGPLQTTPATTTASHVTIRIGTAIAALAASGPPPSAPTPTFSLPGTTPPASVGNGGVATSTAATPLPPAAVGASTSAPVVTTTTPSANASGASPVVAATAPAMVPSSLVDLFDIRSLYLVLIAAALGTLIVAQLVRWIGVRGPWTSSNG